MWSIKAGYSRTGYREFYLTRDTVTSTIPADATGTAVMFQMIIQSQMEPQGKIASKGFLTQAQLNELIKSWSEEKPKPLVTLEELGL